MQKQINPNVSRSANEHSDHPHFEHDQGKLKGERGIKLVDLCAQIAFERF